MLLAKPLEELVAQFERLPGIGPKSAQRLAFHIIKSTDDDIRRFANALTQAKELLGLCAVCQNIADSDLCPLCTNAKRDRSIICVVADPRDLVAIERAQVFHGVYHVLHGLLDPMKGVGPNEIKIKELLNRVDSEVQEILLATNPTIEGDATALYLAKLLKPFESLLCF